MKSLIFSIAIAIMFVGCSPEEEYEEWKNSNSSDSNTTNLGKEYDFKSYFFASGDKNKWFDKYDADSNKNVTGTMLNKYQLKQIGDTINDQITLNYVYTFAHSFFLEKEGYNADIKYENKYRINQTVQEDCILESHEDTITPFLNYTYENVLIVKCDKLNYVRRIGYKLNVGKVYQEDYSKPLDIYTFRMWNGS